MADMQAGIGPFLGVFLLAHGWQSGLIGTVMTIGGVAGMVDDRAGRRAGRCDHAQARSTSSSPASARWSLPASSCCRRNSGWCRVAGRDRHRRRGDRPGRHRHHARHGPAGRLQPAERPQPGLQSRRQHGRRRAVGLARLEVRLRRRVLAGGAVRRAVDRLGADDPQRRRSTTMWRAACGRPTAQDKAGGVAGAAGVQAAAGPGRGAGLFPSRQRRDAAALRAGRGRRPSRAIRPASSP